MFLNLGTESVKYMLSNLRGASSWRIGEHTGLRNRSMRVRIVVSYYIYFWTNIRAKGMNLFILISALG